MWVRSGRHCEQGGGKRDRQRDHEHPADDFPSRHLAGEPAGIGIADRRQRHRREQQQVARRERAAALAQRERDHESSANDRCDPEQRVRPFVGDQDSDQRRRDRKNPQHHAAMRGIDGLHRQRHQQRKQNAYAQHCDHQLRPQPARRQRPAQREQQRERAQPAIAVRSAVSAIGSIADTAMRVAGSVPLNTAMPTKPSSRPKRSCDDADDMGRADVTAFRARTYSAEACRMAAMRLLSRAKAAPEQNYAGQKQ